MRTRARFRGSQRFVSVAFAKARTPTPRFSGDVPFQDPPIEPESTRVYPGNEPLGNRPGDLKGGFGIFDRDRPDRDPVKGSGRVPWKPRRWRQPHPKRRDARGVAGTAFLDVMDV